MAGKTIARKPGEGDALWVLNGLYEIKASSDETDGTLTAIQMTIPPGMGPPPHVHEGGESVFVIEGQVRYHIGGEAFEGGPGTFFYAPPGVEENFEPVGDTPVKLLVIYTPGGMDKFFAEAGEGAQRREVPSPSEPDLERIVKVAEKHGMKMRIPAPH